MVRGVYCAMENDAKFWAKVQKTSGCWEWTGSCRGGGYGGFNGRPAHRISWEMRNGKAVPVGFVVMHSCDNRKCVNPAHLSVGTQGENIRDASRKGRLSKQDMTHCVRGHELTVENVYLRPRGGRTCLTCRRAYNGARKKRLRAAGPPRRAYHRKAAAGPSVHP